MLTVSRSFLSALILVAVTAPLAAAAGKPAEAVDLGALEAKVFRARPSEQDFAQLASAVQQSGSSARAHYILGIAYGKSGYAQLAHDQFDLVKRQDPQFASQMVQRFKDDLARHDFVANTTGLFARDVDPHCPEILFLDGLADRSMGRYDAALKKFATLTRQGAKLDGLATATAGIYLKLGQNDVALRLAQTDAQRKPVYFETNMVRGVALARLHRYQEALLPLRAAYLQRPLARESRADYMEALLKTGKPGQAMDPCLVSTVAPSSRIDAVRDKKLLTQLVSSVTPAQAAAVAKEADAKIGDNTLKPRVYFNLSDAYDHNGDYRNACRFRTLGLRLAPQYADGYYRMAQDLVELHLFGQAARFYAKAQRLDPLDPSKRRYDRKLRRAVERSSAYKNDLAAHLKDSLHTWLQLTPMGRSSPPG